MATAVAQLVAIAASIADTVVLCWHSAVKVYSSTASLSLWMNALWWNWLNVSGSGHRLRTSLAPPAFSSTR